MKTWCKLSWESQDITEGRRLSRVFVPLLMRVLCSNRTACGWHLSLSGSCKRTFTAIRILSWEESVRSAVLITGLLQWDRDWGKQVRRDLWRLSSSLLEPGPASAGLWQELLQTGWCMQPPRAQATARKGYCGGWGRMLSASSAFLQLSAHACFIHADTRDLERSLG